jgi:hypothetical protein
MLDDDEEMNKSHDDYNDDGDKKINLQNCE